MTHRRAFTIVELLVVIAILVILIALLIPGLGTAREATRDFQCRHTLNGVQMALDAYQRDNRGNLIFARSQWSSPHDCWFDRLRTKSYWNAGDMRCSEGLDDQEANPYAVNGDASYWQYDRSSRLEEDLKRHKENNGMKCWYGLNGGNAWVKGLYYVPGSNTAVNLDQVLNRSAAISVYDGWDVKVSGRDFSSARHRRGQNINYATLDGSVAGANYNDVPMYMEGLEGGNPTMKPIIK